MDNNNKNSHAAVPPMTFAMPMFHDFVPKAIRPWIYLLLAFCFQFSNGMYLGAMNNIVGEWGIMREDVQMCLYATLIGMALYFPVLFRMKFRFTNKLLIMSAAVVILVCNLVATFRLPLPVLWIVCVICGMAKIQGTFECMSTIQLWMTPKRDFGVFFPILHIVLLTSIEFTGYLAAWFAYDMHWTYMYWFVASLMILVLLVQAALTRPFHAMPQIVPLKGIDWFGAILWCVFWMQVAWLLNYGDWLDWWHSSAFRLITGTMLLTFAVCLQRMFNHPKPYFELAMWRYHNVVPVILLIGVVEALFSCEHVLEMIYYEEVMHYADHTYEALNQWSLIGIWAGCLFSLGWFRLMRWNVYKLIAFALFAFSIYAGGFYFLVDTNINIEQLRIPLVWRGFSYAVLCISFMWCLHAIMSFEHFFQALSVFNVLHMFVGGLVGAALHAFGMKYYMADGFARCSGYIDSVRMTATNVNLPQLMNTVVEGFMAQSIKILFGWTLLAGLFFALLMMLWDIPMVRYQIKHIPLWPNVGMRVWRGFNRQQRLKRLRQQRRMLLHS